MQIKQKEFHKRWTNKKETFQSLDGCGGKSRYHFRPKHHLNRQQIAEVR